MMRGWRPRGGEDPASRMDVRHTCQDMGDAALPTRTRVHACTDRNVADQLGRSHLATFLPSRFECCDAAAAVRLCPTLPAAWEAVAESARARGDRRTAVMALSELWWLQPSGAAGMSTELANRRREQGLELQPSARERRWSDAGEGGGEEAEGDAGPRPAHPLQGDAIARAEGFGVTDVPAAADENHLSSILDSEDDML